MKHGMKDHAGRSYTPGNDEGFKPINIATPHPELLQPGHAKATPGDMPAMPKVPGRDPKKFRMNPKKA